MAKVTKIVFMILILVWNLDVINRGIGTWLNSVVVALLAIGVIIDTGEILQSKNFKKNLIAFLGVLLIGYMLFTAASVSEKSVPYTFPEPIKGQDTYSNSIGMNFVLIPAGEFKMGSPLSEEGRYDSEGPLHTVVIKKAYYLGKYEVTQKQWHEVMKTNPSDFKGDDLPVEQVSWDDIQEFIRKLNEKEGVDKYRLPSEAEWEYAARAGTTTLYSFGNSESNLGNYAWYAENSDSKTHPVGQKKPNLWGLYDVHGNVWEWVQDDWHDDYGGAPTDGSTWEDGSTRSRVIRGGSWDEYGRYCRSAFRDDLMHDTCFREGFRLLREE